VLCYWLLSLVVPCVVACSLGLLRWCSCVDVAVDGLLVSGVSCALLFAVTVGKGGGLCVECGGFLLVFTVFLIYLLFN
jgi:hypothetical protein